MSDADIIHNTIKRLALFASCDDRTISRFCEQSTLLSIDKGQNLFVHEEKATRFFVIVKGWVKLFRETLDGTQAIIDILPENNVFGETSIFQDDIYDYSAEAIETAQLISIPLYLLKSEIDTNSKLTTALLYEMAKTRRQQDRELEHKNIQNAPQRIGCFLLRLSPQKMGEPLKIHLPYDKNLVAARLGMQPETFSRALTKLKQETGLEIKGSTVNLDNINTLVGFSCAACSSEFPCKDLKDKKTCC